MSDYNPRSLLKEVYDGYSKVSLRGGDFPDCDAFYKHPCFYDQEYLDNIYNKFFEKARADGAPTIKEKLVSLDELGVWTKKDEGELNNRKKFLEGLNKTKGKLFIKKQIEQIDATINEESEKLLMSAIERNESLGETCETYASRKAKDYCSKILLFSDKELSAPFFSSSDFEEASQKDLSIISLEISNVEKRLSLDALKKLVCDVAFYNMFCLYPPESPYLFFGKNHMDLSDFQLSLLILGKTVRSIYEKVDNVPKDISDYDSLIQYVESSSEKRKIIERANDKDGFSAVGLTKDDMNEMGVSSPSSMTPFELLKKTGKSKLTKSDFIS